VVLRWKKICWSYGIGVSLIAACHRLWQHPGCRVLMLTIVIVSDVGWAISCGSFLGYGVVGKTIVAGIWYREWVIEVSL